MGSARKNKRNSTIQSVDHINSLMDTSRSKPRIHRLPSQPINRFRSRTPQALRREDIWEIPSSSPAKTRPLSRRVPQTDIISPRRSGRIRKHPPAEWVPRRRSQRLLHVREESEVHRHQPGDEDDNEDNRDSEDDQELDEGIDKHLSRRLIETMRADTIEVDNPGDSEEEESDFTGDIPYRIPSPPEIDDGASSMDDEQDDPRDEPEMAVHTATSEGLGGDGRPQSTTPAEPPRWEPDTTAVVTRRHTLAAQDAEQASRPSRTKRQTRSSLFEQPHRYANRKESIVDLENQGPRNDSSSESDYLGEEESESESGSEVQSESESEPELTPKTEAGARVPHSTRGVEKDLDTARSTPISVHSDPSESDGGLDRRIRPRSRERMAIDPIHPVTHQRVAVDEARAAEESAGGKAWFTEAANLGGQKDNWDTLITEAIELKEHSQLLSRPQDFVEMKKHLSTLRTKYTKIIKQLKSQHGPLREDLQECANRWGAISREGSLLLDSIYYLAIRRDESYQLLVQAEELAEEFEVRVLPALIKLILLCFEGYYNHRTLFPSSLRHLAGLMKLLLQLCDRVVSLRDERYLTCHIHSRTIRKALLKLMEALDFDFFERQPDTGLSSCVVCPSRDWSEDEKTALIDGLKLFQGEDRYIRLVCHFGERLRNRTLEELQTKARDIHDRLIPRIQEDLLTADGRRLWQWLLSVR